MRIRWAAYAGVRERDTPLTFASTADFFLQVSVALAGGVVLKALHQRPNFYSAAVYLAQSSANLMVRPVSVLLLRILFIDSGDLDPNEPRFPNRMHRPPRPPETPVWPAPPNRDRATLREGMVCRYGNLSCDDDIPR